MLKKRQQAKPGTILVLVLVVITVIVLELAMLSTILVRSFGEEAVTATDNTMARYALQTAFTRIEQDLISYIIANGTTNVTTAFAAGGASAINSASLTATDPETGTAGQATNVVISASVATKRGYYYKLMATARIGDVNITAYKWIKLNPSASCTASGGLSTIATGLVSPGVHTWDALMVDTVNGRVYFADGNSPNINVYSWQATTGLSTVLVGAASAFLYQKNMDSTNHRAYFSFAYCCGNTGGFIHKHTVGLTQLSWEDSNDYNSTQPTYTSTGRIFFSTGNNFYTWDATTGLTTIIGGTATAPGNNSLAVDAVSGRVYFGENKSTGADFYTWHPTTGLSTILGGTGKYPGSYALAVYPSALTPKVLFGSYVSTNGNLYLWTPSEGVSTLLVNRKYPGNNYALGFDTNGRAFFGEGGATTSNFYTYNAGILSTLATTNSFEGFIANPSSGRVYFGSTPNYWTTFYSWHSSTGLSTLYGNSAAHLVGHSRQGYAWNSDYTKFYVGENWGTYVLEYTEATNAWAVIDTDTDLSRMVFDTTNNLLFYSLHTGTDATGRVMVYNPATGVLSTIVSSANKAAGYRNLRTGGGYTYFGENVSSATGNFYVWTPPSTCP